MSPLFTDRRLLALPRARAVAFDQKHRKLYVASVELAGHGVQLIEADLDGTDQRVVRENLGIIRSIAVDPETERIYYGEFENQRISWVSFDGTDGDVVLDGKNAREGRTTPDLLERVVGIALDPMKSELYFTHSTNPNHAENWNRLGRFSLDPADSVERSVTTFLLPGSEDPIDTASGHIALDLRNRVVYFGEVGQINRISKVSMDYMDDPEKKASVVVVVDNTSPGDSNLQAQGMALDMLHGILYFSTSIYGPGSIHSGGTVLKTSIMGDDPSRPLMNVLDNEYSMDLLVPGLDGASYVATWDVPPGDLDADGEVDIEDFRILKADFNSRGTFPDGPVFPKGDVNFDGNVGLLDFNILKRNFGMTWEDAAIDISSSSPVPEPSAAVLLGAGIACFCAWCSIRRVTPLARPEGDHPYTAILTSDWKSPWLRIGSKSGSPSMSWR